MEPLATGSGITAVIAALAYVAKLFIDWRRAGSPRVHRDSVNVSDAQSANAILVASLEGLQIENARLVKRVVALEAEGESKDRKIDDLERRLNDIARELSALKTH